MFDDDNRTITLKMPALELSEWPNYQAEYLKRHLAQEIYLKEGNPKRDHELEMANILKRIVPEE